MSRLNVLFGDNVRLCKVLGDSLGKQGASFESSSAKSRPEITSESAFNSCSELHRCCFADIHVELSRGEKLRPTNSASPQSFSLMLNTRPRESLQCPPVRSQTTSRGDIPRIGQQDKLRFSRSLLSFPLVADRQPIYVGLKNDSTGSAHCKRTTQFSQSRAGCH